MHHDSPPSTNSTPEPSSPSKNTNTARATAALITRLLAHFWTADDNQFARKAQITDWIDDLIEFGPTTLDKACTEWRQTQTHRPTIAQIRTHCIALQTEANERRTLQDQRQQRWPQWLADIWGSEPDGPIKRQQSLAAKSNSTPTFPLR